MNGEDREVGSPERLHPLMLLTGIGGSIRGMAGGYAFIGYLAVSGRLWVALLSAAALLVMLAGSLFLYWRRFEYRVGRNEIRIDSGIISRTHRSIPFDRIQDVDISQGPVARLLGLAKVKFETGGSAGGGEEEGVLQAIALQRAEEIRTLVRSQRQSGSSQQLEEASEAEEQAPVFAMDLRRVMLAGLFNFSLAIFAGLLGLTQTMGDFVGFDPLRRDFWERTLSAGDPIADYLLANRTAAAVAGLALLVIVGILTGVIRTLLRDYGFRLDSAEIGLRRRRGLLTRTDVTLASRRAQAAIIVSGPVRELFGWSALKVQSLASDEGKEADHMVAPLATPDEIARILEEFGWRPVGNPAYRRLDRAYIWLRVTALAPMILIALLLGMALTFSPVELDRAFQGAERISPPLVLVAILIAASAVAIGLRWLAWRRFGYTLDGDRLLIRSGWWRRRLLILPTAKIQSVDLRQSFVARWFGVASLVFGVAGGRALASHEVPSLPLETARALRDELLSSTS